MDKIRQEEKAVDEEGVEIDKKVNDITNGIDMEEKKNHEFNEETEDELEKTERAEEEKAEAEHHDVENAGEVADAQSAAVITASRQQGQSKEEDAERRLTTLMDNATAEAEVAENSLKF